MKDGSGSILSCFVTALTGITYGSGAWHVYKEQPVKGKQNAIYLAELIGLDSSVKDNNALSFQLIMDITVKEDSREIANTILNTAIPLIEAVSLSSTYFQFTVKPHIISNKSFKENGVLIKRTVFSFIVQEVYLPTVTTTAISSILSDSASSGGVITSSGNSKITAKGVCWSTEENPTIADDKTSDGIGKGTFTSSITGLTKETTYYVRAYATNSAGTSYGAQVSFDTISSAVVPTVTTTAITGIEDTIATGGGNVTDDGGATVTVRGVCWSTSENPTIADDKTDDGTGEGAFASAITGLTDDTTYYVRAYATNSVGTSYGDQVSLTTYITEYQNVYDTFTINPDATNRALQNTMVKTLVDGGVWAKFDLFYLFSQTVDTDGEALKNWKTIGSYNATLVNSPLFTALEGFTGDGATNYINTNYKPASNGVNLTLTSASYGFYQRNNLQNFGNGIVSSGNNMFLNSRSAANKIVLFINDGTTSDYSNSDSTGFHVAARDANAKKAYRNGSLVINATVAPIALLNHDIYILCRNSSGSPANYHASQISLFFAGANLTQSDVTILTNAIETYMDANGKGVI